MTNTETTIISHLRCLMIAALLLCGVGKTWGEIDLTRVSGLVWGYTFTAGTGDQITDDILQHDKGSATTSYFKVVADNNTISDGVLTTTISWIPYTTTDLSTVGIGDADWTVTLDIVNAAMADWRDVLSIQYGASNTYCQFQKGSGSAMYIFGLPGSNSAELQYLTAPSNTITNKTLTVVYSAAAHTLTVYVDNINPQVIDIGEGNTMKLYGIQLGSEPGGGRAMDDGGKFDNIGIWNKALTADEVFSLNVDKVNVTYRYTFKWTGDGETSNPTKDIVRTETVGSTVTVPEIDFFTLAPINYEVTSAAGQVVNIDATPNFPMTVGKNYWFHNVGRSRYVKRQADDNIRAIEDTKPMSDFNGVWKFVHVPNTQDQFYVVNGYENKYLNGGSTSAATASCSLSNTSQAYHVQKSTSVNKQDGAFCLKYESGVADATNCYVGAHINSSSTTIDGITAWFGSQLGYWTNTGSSTAGNGNMFYVDEVTEDELHLICYTMLQSLITEATEALQHSVDYNHAIDDGGALATALATAKAVTQEAAANTDVTTLQTALDNYRATATTNQPAAGDVVMLKNYAAEGQSATDVYMYDDGTVVLHGADINDYYNNSLTAALDDANKNYLWVLEAATGGYYLKNYATGRYLSKQTSQNVAIPTVATTDEAAVYTFDLNGSFVNYPYAITSKANTGTSGGTLMSSLHYGAAGVIVWGPNGNNSHWAVRKCTKQTITDASTNGHVSPLFGIYGETVTMTAHGNENYTCDGTWTVSKTTGGEAITNTPGAHTCSFVMPNEGVSVSATFTYHNISEIKAEALANIKSGVGYPVASVETAFRTAVEAAGTTDAVQEALDAYLSSTDIQYPEVGKYYTFTFFQKNGLARYMYYAHNDGDTYKLTTAAAKAANSTYPVTALMKCVAVDNTNHRYKFVDNAGKYLVWKGSNAGTNSNKGYLDSDDNTWTSLGMEKLMTTATHPYVSETDFANIFGYVTMKGKRSTTQDNNFIARTGQQFDQANAPFYNDNFSSAILVEGVPVNSDANAYYDIYKVQILGHRAGQLPVVTYNGAGYTGAAASDGGYHAVAPGTTVTAADFAATVLTGMSAPVITLREADKTVIVQYSMGDVTEISTLEGLRNMGAGNYKLVADIDASTLDASIAASPATFDGDYHKITGLTVPLFNSLTNAVVKNVILDNVTISGSGDKGAIANTASGGTRIYNCGILATGSTFTFDGTYTSTSTVTSTDAAAGSIVGSLSGNARVVNCYSYADVQGSTYTGGIVGKASTWINSTAVTSDNSFVANCMFYGNVTGGTSGRSPIIGVNSTLMSTDYSMYSYFRYKSLTSADGLAQNGALAMQEDIWLKRFEFFRSAVNNHRDLAAIYALGKADSVASIAKWYIDESIAPWPILKKAGADKKIINRIIPNTGRANEGNLITKVPDEIKSRYNMSVGDGLGYLTVNFTINGTAFNSIKLPITDMDYAHYDYTWGKVVLPFANEFEGWTMPTTAETAYDKICIGWKVTGVTGGTEGTIDDYNFADRNTYKKDVYNETTNPYIFAQGGNFIVPYGVTAIDVEAHFANAFYLSDTNYDHSAGGGNAARGERPTTYNGKTVYTSLATALGQMSANTLPHSQALVLVGNYHYKNGDGALDNTKGLTIMSIDADNDQEPDFGWYSAYTTGRSAWPAVRFDFLPIIGAGMCQKHGSAPSGLNIPYAKGWFEITETAFSKTFEFEIGDGGMTATDNGNGNNAYILNGGWFQQLVRCWGTYNNNRLSYLKVGGNAYINELFMGNHSSTSLAWTIRPINVTGGEITSCFMTGMGAKNVISTSISGQPNNVRFYCAGGKIGKYLSAYNEYPVVDATMKVDHAKIGRFFGGGTTETAKVQGNIAVTMDHSDVDFFCGGPEFGDMASGKTVTVHADGSTFGQYYGAGFGGTALTRNKSTLPEGSYPGETSGEMSTINDYSTLYLTTNDSKGGIAVSYEMESLLSQGGGQLYRFYDYFAALSLANTGNVTSTLNKCKILTNFYGGGCQGKVGGTATSTLTNCDVLGNVYGGGYKAAATTIEVYPTTAPTYPSFNGTYLAFTKGVYPAAEEYTWIAGTPAGTVDEANKTITCGLTEDELALLGTVTGDIILNVNGGTVGGSVYGGGAESSASANASTTIEGGTVVGKSIFGGGAGNTAVDPIVSANIGGNTSVTLNDCTIKSDGDYVHSVFGGGDLACQVGGSATVTIAKSPFTFAEQQRPGNLDKERFAVFGAGYGVNTHVAGHTTIDITNNDAIEPGIPAFWATPSNPTLPATTAEPGRVFNNIYGGGNAGTVGGSTTINFNGKLYANTIYGGGLQGAVNTLITDNGSFYTPYDPAWTTTTLNAAKFDRVVGGETTTLSTNVNIQKGYVKHVFGGGKMGNVNGETVVNIGNAADEARRPVDVNTEEKIAAYNSQLSTLNSNLYVGEAYGGNDITGTVAGSNNGNWGTNLHIWGGNIYNVFGGGNGNYEYYYGNATTYPEKDGEGNTINPVLAQSIAGTDRPHVAKVELNITGNSATDRVTVWGNVYGGGNAASVGTYRGRTYDGQNAILADEAAVTAMNSTIDALTGVSETTKTALKTYVANTDGNLSKTVDLLRDTQSGWISVNLGSHITLKNDLFLGNNGEELQTLLTNHKHRYTDDGTNWTSSEDRDFRDAGDFRAFRRNATCTAFVSLTFDNEGQSYNNDQIQGATSGERTQLALFNYGMRYFGHGADGLVSEDYKPNFNRSGTGDVLSGASDTENGNRFDATDVRIGSLFGGSNCGFMMSVIPYKYIVPSGVVVTDKVVGGCNYAGFKAVQRSHNENMDGLITAAGDDQYHVDYVHGISANNIDADLGGNKMYFATHNYPKIYLDLYNDFEPRQIKITQVDGSGNTVQADGKDVTADSWYGGLVYGGCYNTGLVHGDVSVKVHGNMMKGMQTINSAMDADNISNVVLNNYRNIAMKQYNEVAAVFGAGYGENTTVVGNVKVELTPGKLYDQLAQPTGAMSVYGGGFQGEVVGETTVTYDVMKGLTYSDTQAEEKAKYCMLYGGIYGGGYNGSILKTTSARYNRQSNKGLQVTADGADGTLTTQPNYGNTNVHVKAGIALNAIGGGFAADVEGGTHLTIDAPDAAASEEKTLHTAVMYAYAGNDVTGIVGGTRNWSDPDTGTADAIRSHTHMLIGGGSETGYTGIPFVGYAYAGGNGNWGTLNQEDRTFAAPAMYKVYEHDAEGVPVKYQQLVTAGQFKVPDVESSFIDIRRGNLFEAYGGGNNCTVTGATTVHVGLKQDNATPANSELLKGLRGHYLYLPRVSDDSKTREFIDDNGDVQNHIYRLYGGNNKSDMWIQPTWLLHSGKIGNLYSGCNTSRMLAYTVDGNNGKVTGANPRQDLSNASNPWPGTCGMCLNVGVAPTSATTTDLGQSPAASLDAAYFNAHLYINNLYGGNRIGDVQASTVAKNDGTYTFTPVVASNFTTDFGATLNIYAGHVNAAYGGNDISGNVYNGTNVNICGAYTGDVYGAGNGNYIYKYDPSVTAITETMNTNVYNNRVIGVPGVAKTEEQTTEAYSLQKITGINAVRPNVEKAYLHVGGSATNPAYVTGKIFCGGNSSTVCPYQLGHTSTTRFDLTDYVTINSIFLGSNGEYLTDANSLKDFKAQNEIDKMSDAYNGTVLLDEYMKAVRMTALPVGFSDSFKNADLSHSYIGSFFLGGNQGSMVTEMPKDSAGNVVAGSNIEITFPKTLTMFNKIVAGSNNANITVDGYTHRGGMLYATQPDADYDSAQSSDWDNIYQAWNEHPMVTLNVHSKWENQTMGADGTRTDNSTSSAYNKGANIYGGCYESGQIDGDVILNVYSDMTGGKDKNKIAEANEKNVSCFDIYGGGFGKNSVNRGYTFINFYPYYDGSATSTPSCNNIYGGGEQGSVYGNTFIDVKAGSIENCVYGGSLTGFIHGSTNIIVGQPDYYVCNKMGYYQYKSSDEAEDNLALKDVVKNGDNETQEYTIRRYIGLRRGETVTPTVKKQLVKRAEPTENVAELENTLTDPKWGAIEAADLTVVHSTSGNTDVMKLTSAEGNHDCGWLPITIGRGVYGGGYAMKEGSGDVYAGQYIVCKLTDKTAAMCHDDYMSGSKHLATGMAGNSTILIADKTDGDTEYVTISTGKYAARSVKVDDDLTGMYTKDNSRTAQDGIQRYTIQASGKAAAASSDIYYHLDSHGGIYGDGRFTFCEGMRTAEITGYGYNDHTITSPKLLNTFQRLDHVTLNDCCIMLNGDRDFATNSVDANDYSIARVKELHMNSSIPATSVLLSNKKTDKDDTSEERQYASKQIRQRNYLGFYNNVHFLGALVSNVDFGGEDENTNPVTDHCRDQYGKFKQDGGNNISYYKNKLNVTQSYFGDKAQIDNFKQRNMGTARNMIGINNGYTLKITNAYTAKEGDLIKDKLYYGPVVGVFETYLLTYEQGEGGGYIYADNPHNAHSGVSDHQVVDKTNAGLGFVLPRGNFVFPANATTMAYDLAVPTEVSGDVTAIVNHTAGTHGGGINTYTKSGVTYTAVYGTGSYSDDELLYFTYQDAADGGKTKILEKEMDQYIIDDCFSTGYLKSYDSSNGKDLPTDEAHYWYVEGTKYYYNAAITAYTYNEEREFNLPNTDNVISLSGLAKNQKLKLVSVNWKTTHSESPYSSDLQNYSNTASSYYKLDLSASDEGLYKESAHVDGNAVATPYFSISRGHGMISDATIGQSSTNGATQDSPLLGIRLTDNVDNLEPAYLAQHLVEPDEVDIVLSGQGSAGVEYTYTVRLKITYIQGPRVTGSISIDNCALPGEYIRVKMNDVEISATPEMPVTDKQWWLMPKLTTTNNGATENWVTNTSEGGVLASHYGGYTDTDGSLILPASYLLQDWNVAYGVNIMNVAQAFTVNVNPEAEEAKKHLLVHNYHHMIDVMPRGASVPTMILTADARVYIENAEDMEALKRYINYCNGHSTTSTYGADATAITYTEHADGGENVLFILQNNITMPAGWSPIANNFRGYFVGEGYKLDFSGVTNTGNRALFDTNDGRVVNTGFVNGYAATVNGPDGNMINCYAYGTTAAGQRLATMNKNVTANNIDNCYENAKNGIATYADNLKFADGMVAYNLNKFYLEKRKNVHDGTDSEEFIKQHYGHADRVSKDFQYAKQKGYDDGRGTVYLRTTTANQYGSFHDENHLATDARPTYPNDYLFFGEKIYNGDSYPVHINLSSASNNRVFRTSGFYGSKVDEGFHFNKNIIVNTPTLTAIDFTCQRDGNAPVYGVGFASVNGNTAGTQNIYYAPAKDYDDATDVTGLTVNDKVARNLLVYTDNSGNAYTNTNASAGMNYDQLTAESAISGHHIIYNGGYAVKNGLLHLVDKQDFNAPIEFGVATRTWYEREPQTLAEYDGAGWEGLCLPFDVKTVTAKQVGAGDYNHGEITHFYGCEANTDNTDNADHNQVGHEYWLRGFVGAQDDKLAFARPVATENETGATGQVGFYHANQTAVKYDYNYVNNYLNQIVADTQLGADGDIDANDRNNHNYYETAHTYTGYLPITAHLPYLVSYPGSRYYEFDMTGEKMTYSNGGSVTIRVSDDENKEVKVGSLVFGGTYQTKDGEYYVLNDELVNVDGTDYRAGGVFLFADEDHKALPFRTYYTVNANNVQPYYLLYGVTRADKDAEDEPEEGLDSPKLEIYPDGMYICVDTSYSLTLDVYTTSGLHVAHLDVHEGKNRFLMQTPGVYIVNGKKLMLK